MSIVIQTKAIKIVMNHPSRKDFIHHGSTLYVTFKCPACGKRNKQNENAATHEGPNSLTFNCGGCHRSVEVTGVNP